MRFVSALRAALLAAMWRTNAFSLPWRWWVRSGERLSTGLSLAEVWDTRAGDLSGKAVSGLERIAAAIEEGFPIAESMRASGLRLPLDAWCLLQSGERTGTLAESMKEIGRILHASRKRRREMAGQLWYPGLVLLVGIFVMALILLWVIPRMRDISVSMGQGEDLPWLTENIGILYGAILIGLSAGVALTTLILIILILLGKHTVACSRLLEALLGPVPLVGKIRFRMREARLLRQIGTLLKAGITLPEALRLAASTEGSLWVAGQLMEMRSRLLMGAGFSGAIEACVLVHSGTRLLLNAGQEGGRLDQFMARVAQENEEENKFLLDQLVRLLEPFILLFLAGAVGGLILAYLLPMLSILENSAAGF